LETHVTGVAAGVWAALIGVYVVVVAVVIWANVRIIRRSGYSGWWVLIGLVPVANVVMYLVFAFKEAPVERELKQLRAWAARNQNYGGQYPSW
jgi:hypothetical protein